MYYMQDMGKPRPVDTRAIAKRCTKTRIADDGKVLRSAQDAHLQFGPRWDVLRSTALGDGEGLARLSLPDAAHRDIKDGYLLHPALLDLATGWAMDLIPGYTGAHLWVPLSYERIRVYGPLPGDILSWVRLRQAEDGRATFDITLCDKTGAVLLDIAGFSVQRIEGQAGFVQAPLTDAEIPFDGPATIPPPSPAE